jgi:hypothetical protein
MIRNPIESGEKIKHIVYRGRRQSQQLMNFHSEQESLYSKWARVCFSGNFGTIELSKILNSRQRRQHILDPQCLGWRDSALPNYMPVRIILGLTAEQFRNSLGLDLFETERCARLTMTRLRYCPLCMAHGYHATLFQHFCLRVCPLHQVPLMSKCSTCMQMIEPTWESAARHPFSCTYCGRLLLRTVSDPKNRTEVRLADLLLAERRRTLSVAKMTSFRVKTEPFNWPGSCIGREDAVARRAIHRHLVWPTIRGQDGWTNFKETAIDVHADTSPCNWDALSIASAQIIGRTIAKLFKVCDSPEPELRPLSDRMGVRGSGRRFRMKVSVTTAALYKTAFLYGVSPFDGDDRYLAGKTTDQKPVQRGCVLTHSIAGNNRLVEYEVLAMFCVILKRLAILYQLELLEWREPPPECQFCPAWCFEFTPTLSRLSVRPRADWYLVNRLIDRYADRVLL